MISQATVCESQPRRNASRQERARTSATKSGARAKNARKPSEAFGKASAKSTPERMERRYFKLLLEQGVEGLARIVRRLRLPAFVRREVLHDLGREERALVRLVLAGDTRRDVFPALPQRGGVEEAAVPARMKVCPALESLLLGRQVVQAVPQLTALIALERLGAEAACGAPARRAFHPLPLRLRTRPLRPLVAAAAGRVRGEAARVLVTTMLVFAIAHDHHLTKTK